MRLTRARDRCVGLSPKHEAVRASADALASEGTSHPLPQPLKSKPNAPSCGHKEIMMSAKILLSNRRVRAALLTAILLTVLGSYAMVAGVVGSGGTGRATGPSLLR
jgi:hypothetical protein